MVVCGLGDAEKVSAYGGEDYIKGGPWHHLDITLRALAGDVSAYSEARPSGAPAIEGKGFSRAAAMSIALACPIEVVQQHC